MAGHLLRPMSADAAPDWFRVVLAVFLLYVGLRCASSAGLACSALLGRRTCQHVSRSLIEWRWLPGGVFEPGPSKDGRTVSWH